MEASGSPALLDRLVAAQLQRRRKLKATCRVVAGGMGKRDILSIEQRSK